MAFDITKLSDQHLKAAWHKHRKQILTTLSHPTTWFNQINRLLMVFFK
ncbi:hypothetical protein [Latilactobacillus sakei]|nr:hypothetical protein [Latilactobacillus sakei]WEY49654.1 hypothetical protein P3T66_05985 [Latilactobacillus sakei]